MRSWYLAVLVLAGCKGGDSKPRAEPAPKPEVTAQPNPDVAQMVNPMRGAPDSSWWEQENPCPEGASLSGAAPPNGREIFCGLPDGRQHGRVSKWSKLGTLKAEGEHRNGIKHGTFTAYHGNGQPSMRVEFVDGKENGSVTTWHTNGVKALEGSYKDGAGSGPWKKWDRDGKLVDEGDYDVAPAK